MISYDRSSLDCLADGSGNGPIPPLTTMYQPPRLAVVTMTYSLRSFFITIDSLVIFNYLSYFKNYYIFIMILLITK
jgi:hypothetical protein